jgi:hypothetical protein
MPFPVDREAPLDSRGIVFADFSRDLASNPDLKCDFNIGGIMFAFMKTAPPKRQVASQLARRLRCLCYRVAKRKRSFSQG